MNKTELVAAIAEKTLLSKKDSNKAVNAVLETITEELEKEEKVTLVGFGTFEVRHRKERMGRNPATKEPIKIPASKSPAFRAGKNLKDRVNS